jgi:hypothetical protein
VALWPDALDQVAQPISVRRRGKPTNDIAVVADQADIQTPATEI